MARRYSPETKAEVAEALVLSRTEKHPNGQLSRVGKMFDIPRRTVEAWRKDDRDFHSYMADAEKGLYEAQRNEAVVGEGTLIEKLTRFQHLAADRLLELLPLIPPEKLPAAIREAHHVTQLEQGKPTDIVEHLSELPEEELELLLAEAGDQLDRANEMNRRSH
jgi:transposase-like protein